MLPAISSTVKKANAKADDLEHSFKSTNAVHPATGKPPMSITKRSGYSSKAESYKTVESVHHTPDKTNKLTSASPRRPLVLEPIQNPPLLENRTDI